MGDENEQDRDREVRERIAGLVQANQFARKTQIGEDELQKLKIAAERLDQWLSNAADAEVHALRTAVTRLDQLLADITTGKDAVKTIKRRGDKNDS